MSDWKESPASPEATTGEDREPYEAPRLTTVGNARDLLAGLSGTVADTCPCGDTMTCPNFPGGA
jgi:hypothetical protein